MAELLEEQVAGTLNDRQAYYVKGIVESGERLLNVVNSILGYTHLLSGKVSLDAGPCELASLLAICATSQQRKAAARQQTITVMVDPPVHQHTTIRRGTQCKSPASYVISLTYKSMRWV